MDFIVSYQIYNQNRLQASRDIQDQLIQPEQGQEQGEQQKYKEQKDKEQGYKEQQEQQKQKDLAKREEQKFVKNNCCNCGQDPYFCQCSEIIKLITKFKPEKISY